MLTILCVFRKKVAIPGLEVSKGVLCASKAVADAALAVCSRIIGGVEYVTDKKLIPELEAVVAKAGADGDKAFKDAQAALVAIDHETAKLVADGEDALKKVQTGGDVIWKAAQKELNDFIVAGRVVLQAAQKAVDDLAQCSEYLVFQAATATLALAKHVGEHAVAIAEGALTVAKAGDVFVLDVAEDVVEAATILQVTSVNMAGSLKDILSGGKFKAKVELKIEQKPITLEMDFDLRSTENMVVEVFKTLWSHGTSKTA